ncbi:MAG: hypothetical protein FGM57_02080 [Candidatus Taylorbacteria bacterium]|nr:hypothetical protein [Candidatus Taylorbacteria bacterium]
MKNTLLWVIGFFVLLGIYALLNYDFSAQKSIPKATETWGHKIKSAELNPETNTVAIVFDTNAVTTVSLGGDFPVMSVEHVDINFDGADDLMIVESAGAYNLSTRFVVNDISSKKFNPYNPFEKLLGVEGEGIVLGAVDFDMEQKTIRSFFKGRGLGDMFTVQYFTFKDGQWRYTGSEIQDMINFEQVMRTEGPATMYYIHTKTAYDIDTGATTTVTNTYFKSVDLGEMTEVSKSEVQKKGLVK